MVPYSKPTSAYSQRVYRPIPTGMPTTYLAKLRYVTQVNLMIDASGAPQSDTIYYTQIKANGIFDPTVALGGHQPMFVDQICAMGYTYWCVRSSKCTVTPVFGVISNFQPAYVGMLLDSGTTPTPTVDATSSKVEAMLEYSERNVGAVKPMIYGAVGQPAYKNRTSITQYYDAVKFWRVGQFSDIYNASGQFGLCNASGPTTDPVPGATVNFNIWATGVDPDVTPSDGKYLARIDVEYTVLFLRDTTVRIAQS